MRYRVDKGQRRARGHTGRLDYQILVRGDVGRKRGDAEHTRTAADIDGRSVDEIDCQCFGSGDLQDDGVMRP